MNRRKVEEGELNILMSFDQLSLFLCVACDSYVTARWYVSCAWEVMRLELRLLSYAPLQSIQIRLLACNTSGLEIVYRLCGILTFGK